MIFLYASGTIAHNDFIGNPNSDSFVSNNPLVAYQLATEINTVKSAVRRKIRNDEVLAEGEISLIDGGFHIMFAIRQIILRESKDLWEFNDAKAAMHEGIKVIEQLYIAAQDKDANFSSNRFFKDPVTKDIVIRKAG